MLYVPLIYLIPNAFLRREICNVWIVYSDLLIN